MSRKMWKKRQLFIASFGASAHYKHNMLMPQGEERETIHFGPRALGEVRLTDINILQQVRQTFDPAELDDLATSMIVDPAIDAPGHKVTSESFDLANPISVGIHDIFSAERYIRDHGKYHDIPEEEQVKLEHLAWREDGTTVILIAGERRTRSEYILASRFNIDPRAISTSSNEHPNINFDDALGLQLRENVHLRPPLVDEAKAIARFYRSLKARGDVPKLSYFAAQIGFGETKVRDALAFDSLPAEIQDLTATQNLPYSVVRRFKLIADAYAYDYDIKHEDIGPALREKHILDSLLAESQLLLKNSLEGKSETRAAAWIESRAREIRNEADYQNELFSLDMALPDRRRRQSADMLAERAIKALRYQARIGDLRPDDLSEIEGIGRQIEALPAEAKELAASRLELDIFSDVVLSRSSYVA